MAELPSDVLFNIFSRLPVKSLARCRCVSKLWCECINDPYLAIIHGERSSPEEPKPIIYYGHSNPPCIVSFHITKSNETMTLVEDKTNPHKQFKCNPSRRVTMFRGSCNGLIYASQDHVLDKLSLVVIHPINDSMHHGPCLGNQLVANDTKTSTSFHHWRWRVCGRMLVWLNKVAAPPLVTCFDVKEEEFRLISRPKTARIRWMFSLQFVELLDLHGEVGYSLYSIYKIEVWVLKEKEWVMRYVIDLKLPFYASYYIKVGRWNNEGDVGSGQV
ncbi:hypothetical protein E3N88_01306 [Mikania micrantha]|uniref:F-box domain-containing protein n=1 Tax=Mikania micrantha TaxID=192012 RepID=A0A5N6Q3A7_9ASTR|nr:hypothetical protein E3N88_01306 [Mikania micrantha]